MNLRNYLCLGISFLVSLSTLVAQNTETIPKPPAAPEIDAGDQKTISDADATTPAAADEGEEIIPNLKGINVQELISETKTNNDPEIPADVRGALDEFVGKPLKTGTLTLIKGAITNGFESTSGDLVRALIPEQDITPGVLIVQIVRATVEDVTVVGNKWFDDQIYLRNVTLSKGDTVNNNVLFSDIDWLNRNPYRSVFAVYQAGDGFGGTDIIIRPIENRPWSVFGGYDNFGTDLLGRDRRFFGVQHGNLFGRDLRFVYQFFADSEFENFFGHFASITAPLPNRHELTIGAFYSESSAQNVGGVSTLDLDGESYQATADYVIPMNEFRGWDPEFFAGFDFKSSNSNLEFGLDEVFDTTTQLFQFRAGFDAEKEDRLGSTRVRKYIAFSMGEWTNGHSDDAFGASRGGADTEYLYFRIDVDRTWELGDNGWTLETDLRGQVSTSNLLASEQLGLSGSSAVRGFEDSSVRGDHAILTRVQLNAPPLQLPKIPGGAGLQGYGFFDWGWGTSVDAAAGESDVSLSSVGIGVRGAVGERGFFNVGYGWQVGQSGFEDDESGMMHIQATVRW